MASPEAEEIMKGHRLRLHAEKLATNPGRDFVVLFGDAKYVDGSTIFQVLYMWLDGKGELL